MPKQYFSSKQEQKATQNKTDVIFKKKIQYSLLICIEHMLV